MKHSKTWLAIYGVGILFVTCPAIPAPKTKTLAAHSNASCAVVGGKLSPQKAAAIKALQRNIETSPLYTIPANTKGLVACSISYQPDGVIKLEYQFREGSWLHVTHDQRIEYMEQNASFPLPSSELPEAILARAERVAFGSDDCRIDWNQPETPSAKDASGVKETVFWGDVCNCQAHIRRNADGLVVGFMLRSAC